MFDPSEIKERRLGDEDRAIANSDRPERHQLVNSTLSDNPIPAPDMLFPPPELASGWAYNKISIRTGYIFCGMGEEGTYPEPSFLDPNPLPAVRRPDLVQEYISAVARALDMMFVQNLEVPYLWHYKRDAFSKLENQGQSSVQFLERDELWMLYNLGTRFRAIYERTEQMKDTWRKIKERKPEIEDAYLIQTLLPSVCMMSVEAAAEGNEWLGYHYAEDIRRIKEDEAIEEGKKRLPERLGQEDLRSGPILKLVEVGLKVSMCRQIGPSKTLMTGSGIRRFRATGGCHVQRPSGHADCTEEPGQASHRCGGGIRRSINAFPHRRRRAQG